MRALRGQDRTADWETSWLGLGAGHRAKALSRSLNVTLIIGLSALLWELLLTVVWWLAGL